MLHKNIDSFVELEYSVGIDHQGHFLQERLVLNDSDFKPWTRHYYESVDKLLIENMPDSIFNDLKALVESESIRRDKL